MERRGCFHFDRFGMGDSEGAWGRTSNRAVALPVSLLVERFLAYYEAPHMRRQE